MVLLAKLFSIQVVNHDKYAAIAERQQNKEVVITAERGMIKDRSGNVLAYTKDDVSFYADPRMLNKKERDSVAAVFSRALGKSKTHYLKILNGADRTICLEEKAPKEKAIELKKFVMDGIFSREDYTRVYPYGSLASHVVGYVDKDAKGTTGVERWYDDKLQGDKGYMFIERDVLGRMVSVNDEFSKEPSPGGNIQLTINATYQKIMEEELLKGMEAYESDSAVGLILDPNNGEILAMASMPNYDPNNYGIFKNFERRNRVLTDRYEPGSTIKAIIMSMLIEKGLVRDDEIIDTENGYYRLPGAGVRDSHKYEKLTVREVLEHSSNVGMSKLSERIEPRDFYKFLRDFGFGNETSIDLPGEVTGYLKKPDKYSKISKNFMSFGYEISMTPLQLAAAYGALVNGGSLYQPYIVKNIADAGGSVIKNREPLRIRRVISEETSKKIVDYMVGVVENGTGKNAKLSEVFIGGKTGTAQRYVNGAYTNKEHNSSFIGFFPADNPKVLCLVLLYAPKSGMYGGTVAAPVFREVAKRIVEADASIVPNKEELKHSNAIDDMFASVQTNNKQNTFAVNNIEHKKEESSVKDISFTNRTTMPNLKDYSMREAVSIVTQLGMEYKIIGSGNVVSQSVAAGSKINKNEIVLIKCEAKKDLKGLRIN